MSRSFRVMLILVVIPSAEALLQPHLPLCHPPNLRASDISCRFRGSTFKKAALKKPSPSRAADVPDPTKRSAGRAISLGFGRDPRIGKGGTRASHLAKIDPDPSWTPPTPGEIAELHNVGQLQAALSYGSENARVTALAFFSPSCTTCRVCT